MNVKEGTLAALKHYSTVHQVAHDLATGYAIDPLVDGHHFKVVGGSAVISDGSSNTEYPLADGEGIYIPGRYNDGSSWTVTGTGTLHVIWHTN